MTALILGLGWYSVQILVSLNEWNRQIYDAIQSLQEVKFWTLFWGFDLERLWLFITIQESIHQPSLLEIILIYVPISAYTGWQTQRAVFKWREATTNNYLRRWERSKVKVEGASQRMQSDLQVVGKTVQRLVLGFMLGIFVLLAFIPILWEKSAGIPVWNGQIIPGFLVWFIIGVVIIGSYITLGVTWKLPHLETQNEVVEARFRKQLVLSEDNYAMRGTAALFPMFQSIKRNYYRLFNWYFSFGLWQSLFGLCVGNFALIALAPAYFDQLITLGVFFQVLNAFGRVESSMSYFIDNWGQIVDVWASIKRVTTFDKALRDEEKNGVVI
jgi:peptide/bleomycin uptake transporter